MSMLPDPDLPQGVYKHFNGELIFVVYQPVDERYMFKYLRLGDTVGGYDSGYKYVFETLLKHCTCLAPGWLPTDAVVSDIYPELFI